MREDTASFPSTNELRCLRRMGPVAMEPWACSRYWMPVWWQLVCLFLLKDCKMCRDALGSCFFYDCLQADGMVIHCILFCVWRCSGFVQTFSTFFFHLLPLPRNMSSLSSPHCRGHWKSLFANEACKDGEWAGCAEKHVPECFSPTQPGWKEKLSTPQAAYTAPALSFPPPYFKFHNWESRA